MADVAYCHSSTFYIHSSKKVVDLLHLTFEHLTANL